MNNVKYQASNYLEHKVFRNSAVRSDSVLKDVKDFVNEFNTIITIPKYSKEGDKTKFKSQLSDIIRKTQTFMKQIFESMDKDFRLLKSEKKKRETNMMQYVDELKPKKGKTPTKEPALTESQKEIIKKGFSKDALIEIIKKRLPDANVEDLKKLSYEDLMQVSTTIGINLLDLNTLKLPANAYKDQKELVENLENIRRERKIQEEFERYKSEITNEKTLSEKESCFETFVAWIG